MSETTQDFAPVESEPMETDDLDALEEGELNATSEKEITLDKADRSLSELHRWHNTGRIIIDPEWQRNYVWDRNRASKLIESFLLDIPVPVIYLAKTPEGKYEVIDGLQRLTSVFNFIDNKYRLSRLDILTDLNGKLFRELPEKQQHKLEDCVLRSFELSSTASPDIHFIVFERLNTGGVKLNDMEIRNCLYRGTLNDLIKSLAGQRELPEVPEPKQLREAYAGPCARLAVPGLLRAYASQVPSRSQEVLERVP